MQQNTTRGWGSILRGTLPGGGAQSCRGTLPGGGAQSCGTPASTKGQSCKHWEVKLNLACGDQLGVGFNLTMCHFQIILTSHSHMTYVQTHTCIHQLMKILFLSLRPFFPYHSCNREAISNSRENPQEIFPTKRIMK